MSKHRRPGDRRPGLVLAALAVAGVTLLGASSPALAARGGGGGKASDASLDVVLVESADAVVSHGDRITFHVAQTKTDRPFVGLKCWQGTTGVYNSSIGIFEQYMFDPWLTLDSSYWSAAVDTSCTARLYYYDRRGNQAQLATMNFTVAP